MLGEQFFDDAGKEAWHSASDFKGQVNLWFFERYEDMVKVVFVSL